MEGDAMYAFHIPKIALVKFPKLSFIENNP